VVPYTSGKILSACLIFLFFLAVCLNISTVINIKILTNSNQQTRSYKFTCHIATFLSGFEHRDAWNLHSNIIWSKCSTDFKELSPCSVWYPLKMFEIFIKLYFFFYQKKWCFSFSYFSFSQYTVRPVLRGHIWDKEKTGDLLKEVQFMWNVLWQDKKRVTF
jgi:hypothetical protein